MKVYFRKTMGIFSKLKTKQVLLLDIILKSSIPFKMELEFSVKWKVSV